MKNLTYILLLFVATVNAQIEVIQYNAEWNSGNNLVFVEFIPDAGSHPLQ